MRAAHEIADKHDDVATASILENFIDAAEKRNWFLFEASRTGDGSDTEKKRPSERRAFFVGPDYCCVAIFSVRRVELAQGAGLSRLQHPEAVFILADIGVAGLQLPGEAANFRSGQ